MFEVSIVAEQKQTWLVTIFCSFKVLIALNPLFPPLPLSRHWNFSQNVYAFNYGKYLCLGHKPSEPHISILLTANKLINLRLIAGHTVLLKILLIILTNCFVHV